MKRETAIEWLISELYSYPIDDIVIAKIEHAKKLFQQQIINAHHDAYMDLGFEHSADDCAINYYRYTYEQKN